MLGSHIRTDMRPGGDRAALALVRQNCLGCINFLSSRKVISAKSYVTVCQASHSPAAFASNCHSLGLNQMNRFIFIALLTQRTEYNQRAVSQFLCKERISCEHIHSRLKGGFGDDPYSSLSGWRFRKSMIAFSCSTGVAIGAGCDRPRPTSVL
jgi:hypothetical protein